MLVISALLYFILTLQCKIDVITSLLVELGFSVGLLAFRTNPLSTASQRIEEHSREEIILSQKQLVPQLLRLWTDLDSLLRGLTQNPDLDAGLTGGWVNSLTGKTAVEQ